MVRTEKVGLTSPPMSSLHYATNEVWCFMKLFQGTVEMCLCCQTFLKEVLKEICNYNMKAPHKNMWELKEEYRHYRQNTTDSSN